MQAYKPHANRAQDGYMTWAGKPLQEMVQNKCNSFITWAHPLGPGPQQETGNSRIYKDWWHSCRKVFPPLHYTAEWSNCNILYEDQGRETTVRERDANCATFLLRFHWHGRWRGKCYCPWPLNSQQKSLTHTHKLSEGDVNKKKASMYCAESLWKWWCIHSISKLLIPTLWVMEPIPAFIEQKARFKILYLSLIQHVVQHVVKWTTQETPDRSAEWLFYSVAFENSDVCKEVK